MDSKRAAEVLRSLKQRGGLDANKSLILGAQALEAWAWVEQHDLVLRRRPLDGWECFGRDQRKHIYGHGPTPLLAILDAMEKEGKG